MRIVVFIVAFLFSLGQALADKIVTSSRVSSEVTVRKSASSSSAVIGVLKVGEQAQYLGDAPHRYHIQLPNGAAGYVSKAWTRRIPDPGVATAAAVGHGRLEIHFIDVGQGDSTLVICPNGQRILVDAGSTGGGGEEAIRDYILEQIDRTERRIDVLVITHPDKDHYNLLPDVLRDIPIGHAYRVGEMTDYMTAVRPWLKRFTANQVTVLDADAHDPIDHPNNRMECGAADVWILAAAIESDFSPKNTASIVLMIRYGDFEAILTGDATRVTESEIMRRYPNDWLQADLLKIGHHGSLATSTTEEWARVVKPKMAVASAGYTNSFGHPRKEIVDRLEPYTEDAPSGHPMRYATGSKPDYVFTTVQNYREQIYSTSASGNLVVISNGSGYAVTARPHE